MLYFGLNVKFYSAKSAVRIVNSVTQNLVIGTRYGAVRQKEKNRHSTESRKPKSIRKDETKQSKEQRTEQIKQRQ